MCTEFPSHEVLKDLSGGLSGGLRIVRHDSYTSYPLDALATRHRQPGHAPWTRAECGVDKEENPRFAKSYVVAQAEVPVSDQMVAKSLAFYGFLNYMIGVVRASTCTSAFLVLELCLYYSSHARASCGKWWPPYVDRAIHGHKHRTRYRLR
ncbi:hypothetical protein B0H16DRAFT_859332 [Mycena metata]|uniref:Uncharacterized protein n=1 Tax=Mycena metata TaxID=1033252 RepID=A0AAD7ITW3_9AGAR|nr:hypothetical protein B0H16DRAFT_859332 [Mycena metata]